MKKKLLALLLASSMALMNVAPAYGTDIFTDPDNVANEDVISVPEELDNNGEFNDTEDEFTSEQTDDDFFSDEKEMPSVQEGDTLVANAGQGITAGTSTYSSKSSFGRRKALSQLQGMGINSGSDGRSYGGLLSGISFIVTKPLGKVNELIEKIHN